VYGGGGVDTKKIWNSKADSMQQNSEEQGRARAATALGVRNEVSRESSGQVGRTMQELEIALSGQTPHIQYLTLGFPPFSSAVCTDSPARRGRDPGTRLWDPERRSAKCAPSAE
jgi:hypothetical protein